MPDVVISALSKVFPRGHRAVDDIDLTVPDGEFFSLLGPSGCGKTTMLACIAGLDTPSEGRITIGQHTVFHRNTGVNMPCEERNLGMVFQSYALWPHMTVEENLAVPLKIRNVPKGERTRLIGDALSMVDLGNLGHRYPHELSGGQQQRVALARALVYSPAVLLLDEPLSNLDARLRQQARAWIKRVQKELRITTIYVTHDQDEALAMSDNVAVMHDGRVIQCAHPREVYERPATSQVAGFVGRMNFLSGIVASVNDGLLCVDLAPNGDRIAAVPRGVDVAPGNAVSIAFRPESVTVLSCAEAVTPDATNRITGDLIDQNYVGFRYEYTVRYGDTILEAYGAGAGRLGKCVVAIDPSSTCVYRNC